MISPGVLLFLSLGVILDIIATIFMMFGSKNTPFTLHGCIGYFALFIMFIVLVIVWRVYLKEGSNSFVSKKVLLFSKIAYGWWVFAYIIGSLLIIWK